MISTRLFPVLNKVIPEDRIDTVLRAFKQDPILWKGIIDQTVVEKVAQSWPDEKCEFTPGSLALFTLDPVLVKETPLMSTTPSVDVLERSMLTFETYLHQQKPVEKIEDSALLALALYKKFEQGADWPKLMREINNQQNIEDSKTWIQFWGSPFAILNGWADDKLSFLQSQLQVREPDFGLPMICHLILTMPAETNEKTILLKNSIVLAPLSEQVNAIKNLRFSGENELAQKTAKEILERHIIKNLEPESTIDIWKSSEKSLETANEYRLLASLAQIAGEYALAEKLLKVAFKNYSTELAGIVIQNTSLKTESGKISKNILEQLPAICQDDPAVLDEIAMTSNASEVLEKEIHSPLVDLLNAEDILRAGNETLAKQIGSESAEELGKVENNFCNIVQSERALNWQPVKLLDQFIHLGLWKEARDLEEQIQAQNPGNMNLISRSIKIAEGMNDSFSLINSLEDALIFDTNNYDYKSKLAKTYLKNEEWQNAYEGFDQLLGMDETENIEDYLGFAQAALKTDRPTDAIAKAERALVLSPENGSALAILGYAYHKLGDAERSIEFLNRSVNLSPDSVDPWLLIAEMHTERGEKEKSIDVLKTANTTFPGDQRVIRQLARELLEHGQAADALAVLREAQDGGNPDLENALLMIKAQKSLNLNSVSDLIEHTYRTYPKSPEAIYEYADNQLASGQRETTRKLLKPIIELPDATSEWKLAYVDSIIGEDYRNIHQTKLAADVDVNLARTILTETLMNEPENIHAKVLAAELAIKEGQAQKAFSFLSQLLKETGIENSPWFDRVKAGFAWAATLLKKFELALSSIQSIVEAHSQWAAARQTLAEVEEATGNIEDAATQAGEVLEAAANVAEAGEWYINFLSNLGKQDEAEKRLEILVKTHKDKLPLYEKLAELKFQRGALEEVKEISDRIKFSLPKAKVEDEIVKAAKLFAKIGDKEAVVDALKMRTMNSSASAAGAFTDLAAFYRSNGKLEESLSTLNDAEKRLGKQRWLGILKADTLHELGESQDAFNLLNLLPVENEMQPDAKDLNFVSADWQDLFEDSLSIQSLEEDLAFESGNYAAVFSSEEKNLKNKTVRIEADHALGTGVETIKWLDAKAGDEAVYYSPIFAAQVCELLLDGGEIQSAGEILMEALERYPEDKLLKLQAARQSAMSNNWQTGEALYMQEIAEIPFDMKVVSAKSVCTARNIGKCAMTLDHWNDAFSWSKKLIDAQPENQAAKITRLQTLVKGLEFVEASRDLDIVEHSLSAQNAEKAKIELAALIDNLEENESSEIAHWTIRGKVILDPSQSHIRKLALITPDAEDISAMMFALNRTGQFSTAIQLAKKHENEPLVLFSQAKCQQENDPQAALGTLDKLWNSQVVIPVSYALGGKINQEQKVYYSAINRFEEGLEYWQNESKWHELAADNWSLVGDRQNSTAHLEKALELDPANDGIRLKMGKVLLENNENELAIEQLKTVCKNEVNQYEAWEALAEAYYRSGKADLSLDAAERAADVNAFSVKPHLLSARINLDKGDADKALDQAQKALKQDGKNAEGLLILGKAWLLKGNKLQALQSLEKVPQIKGVSINQLIEHAGLVKEINGAATARGLLESLAENYPDNLDVLNMLAESQLANGEVAAAEKTAQQSIRLNEDQPGMQRFLGNLEFQCGHLDQAVHHFSQAIAQNPQDTETYLELSKVYEQQRDHASAMNTLNNALTLDPKNLSAILAAAALMKNAKDYAKAEELLRRAVEIAPNDLNVRRQLGAVIALNIVESSQEASSNI